MCVSDRAKTVSFKDEHSKADLARTVDPKLADTVERAFLSHRQRNSEFLLALGKLLQWSLNCLSAGSHGRRSCICGMMDECLIP